MTYQYNFLSVPGGGFVTGFLFHQTQSNILYCRTDIGGVYKYDFKQKEWISLVDQVTEVEKYKSYPLSIALDKQNPSRLYMAVGEKPYSAIGFSDDYGEHFEYYETPLSEKTKVSVEIHGNAPGRSTGERLIVDPFNSEVLYLGTMYDGLYQTKDRCKSWEKLVVGPSDESNIAFVAIDERAGIKNGMAKRLIVATSGQCGATDNIRGLSVYISEDGGLNFSGLEGQPKPVIGGSGDYPGYVGQHICFDKEYMYITYSAYNVGWSRWDTYGCDLGKCYDGALYRYKLSGDGNVIEAKDLTPGHPTAHSNSDNYVDIKAPDRRLGYGLSGICTDMNRPGTVILTTITANPDVFYKSIDYGETFQPIMSGLDIGQVIFNTSYQQPKYNGNDSLIHWMSDIKINPFNSDMALFNTGAGVFATNNLTSMEQSETVVFETLNSGIEETVHLNVYAPPKGDVAVIDVIGDYGMFIFEDVDKVPKNTVADVDNNRWITAMNADYADHSGQVIIATMRGNWTGLTKGGLVITKDSGKTWSKLPYPEAINEEIDKSINQLKNPNVTSGWVALSADESHLVWAIGIPLNGDLVLSSHDGGLTYKKVEFIDQLGQVIDFNSMPVKVFSDRLNASRFYGFADMPRGPVFFVSHDFGNSFVEIKGPDQFPNCLLAGIDSQQDIEIRGIPFEAGRFYIALLEQGLWLVEYDEIHHRFTGKKVSKAGDRIKGIGIGINKHMDMKRLYTSGTINGIYGFYCSDDGGYNWIRINDDQHQYGDIRSIDGDKKVPGRFYIATGTRGLIYGDIKE